MKEKWEGAGEREERRQGMTCMYKQPLQYCGRNAREKFELHIFSGIRKCNGFRFNRYPLIIDPSGQAINYLMKQFAGKNITKTSFLDDSFR